MAKKSTYQKYKDNWLNARKKYNKAKKVYDTNLKTKNRLEDKYKSGNTTQKDKLRPKLTKANRAVKKSKTAKDKQFTKYNSAKKKFNSYKSNVAKKKRADTVKRKAKLLKVMQKEKPGYWKSNRPYIIPKYPQTLHSYVFVDNETESETSSAEITTNSIFTGQYINHYTQMQPRTHTIEGKLGGANNSGNSVPENSGGTKKSMTDGLKKQLNMLERWCENGIEIEYHGQRSTSSGVITNVTPNFDEPVTNAIKLSLTIQEVRWANTKPKKKSKSVAKKKKNDTGKKAAKAGTRKKVKPKAGQYVTIKVGDSYWSFHNKFGTSIANLRSWNGFPDRKLPVGKKIRVK